MLVAIESNLKMNLKRERKMKLRVKMELSTKMNSVYSLTMEKKWTPISNKNTLKNNWLRCRLTKNNNNKKLMLSR